MPFENGTCHTPQVGVRGKFVGLFPPTWRKAQINIFNYGLDNNGLIIILLLLLFINNNKKKRGNTIKGKK